MSYFDQYSGAAGGFADQYGIPKPIFFGLIQQESSWNPYAHATTSSAFGFGQLVNGTARQLGVNQNDPLSQLRGSAQYLSSMPGSTWTEKLAHYYQGPGANIGQDGLSYAKSVLDKAGKMFGLGGSGGGGFDPLSAAACAATGGTDIGACANAVGGIGVGSDQCGMLDFVCKLQKWVSKSEFFTRLALSTLALLFILGGLYLMKDRS